MQKKLVLIIAFLAVLLTACGDSSDNSENAKEMVQATTQRALSSNGFDDDTSYSISDWKITNSGSGDSQKWVAVTTSPTNGRVKSIFEWSGNDSDDLILKYLLINGNEVVNDL